MTDSIRTEEFVRLFAAHQVEVFNCILAQVPLLSDAEEVFQQTSTILWRKFDQFEEDTSFLKWACQVSRFAVKNYRRTQQRQRLLFSSELVEKIAAAHIEKLDDLELRRAALASCVEKLAPHDQVLLKRRYLGTNTIKQLAVVEGKPAKRLYKRLARIRQQIHECINRQLAISGEHP